MSLRKSMIKVYKSKSSYMKDNNLWRVVINRLVDEGKLVKLDKGYYSIKDLLRYCLDILLK